MTPTVVGVDVGGTKVAAGLVELVGGGRVLHRVSRPTPATEGPAAVLATVTALVETLGAYAADAGLPSPTALGVGTAGVVDPSTGIVVAATSHLQDWTGTAVTQRLSASTLLPCHVLNDVHAHALGEARLGAGRGHRTVLVVATGTGLGGAVVVDGAVLTGSHGAAGHLGHVPCAESGDTPCRCGGSGHLESVASGDGLREMAERRGIRARDGAAVVALAAAGDPVARDCLQTSAKALGTAIGGWLGVLDPDVVVLTGGLAGAGDSWWDAVRRHARRTAAPVVAGTPIVAAGLGADGAVLGAALAAEEVAWCIR